MKRSKVLREIVKVLKSWENSKLTIKTAKEILNKIEELGMSPAIEYKNGNYTTDWE